MLICASQESSVCLTRAQIVRELLAQGPYVNDTRRRNSFAVANDRLFFDGGIHDISSPSTPRPTLSSALSGFPTSLSGGVPSRFIVRDNLAYAAAACRQRRSSNGWAGL